MKIMAKSLLCVSILALTSCSFLAPVKNDNKRFVIDRLPENIVVAPRHSGTIMVTDTTASSVYDTVNMAYMKCDYKISYFSKNQWVESPTRMFRELITKALDKTQHYHAVVGPQFSGHVDYVVNTELLKLEQDFRDKCSVERLVMRVQLVNGNTSTVIATRLYTVNEPAQVNAPYGGVQAANRAAAEVVADIARLCVRKS